MLKKKKALQYSLDIEYYEKFKEIQKREKRTEADMTRYIVERYIDEVSNLVDSNKG